MITKQRVLARIFSNTCTREQVRQRERLERRRNELLQRMGSKDGSMAERADQRRANTTRGSR